MNRWGEGNESLADWKISWENEKRPGTKEVVFFDILPIHLHDFQFPFFLLSCFLNSSTLFPSHPCSSLYL